MREGWSKRKIEEIATITMGQSPSGNSINETEGVEFHQGKIYFGEKYINESHFYTSEPIRIAEPNSLLLCVRAPIGVVNMTARKICIGRGLCSIKANDSIHSNFLYYALRSQKDYFNKNATGSTFFAISSNVVKDTQISFPSKDKQIQIASELDKITEMISKYDEQLKELDKLSQSIFYEMFGDPVENEKGWEVKKLEEICDKITDGTHLSPKNDPVGDYMYVTAKNIKKDGVIFDNITYIDKETHKCIYSRCNPEYGDVLYIKDGVTTGVATINTVYEEFSLLSSVALLKTSNSIINYYLKYILNMPTMYNNIRSNMGGVAITRLTLVKIKKLLIPLPPLPLQQSFARKIEAIEAMKSKVREAKKEAETLLAARMQYWFE